jgi:hypothetical protein
LITINAIVFNTDHKSLSREARKTAQITSARHKSHFAKLIRLADKITVLVSWNVPLHDPGGAE